MLCRRLNKILSTRSSIHHNSQYRCSIISRSKCSWINTVFAAIKTDPMSSYRLRLILRDLSVSRLWNACFRTQLVSSMVKRCRRDRGVRDMLACFKQTILRPSRTFLLSATAACKSNIDDRKPEPCRRNITDEELEELTKAFDGVDELSRTTLFCEGCKHRLVIDKKHPGVNYCVCPDAQPPGPSEDGWVPYMEAEDVIIWRKEYKPGGLYAYKVYGRYKDLTASTFATIQLDGAYRRSWDDAVAALALVERNANGVRAQDVLHWEVAWPRLFSNRDYVYIRRHKQFEVATRRLAHKEAIFSEAEPRAGERPSVHARARRRGREQERRDARLAAGAPDTLNKVYVIVSRSCTHPAVPEAKSPVRVHEYWSDMVVRSLDGPDQPGMEFVLTYYDEPSVGGLPGGVSAWATGRAAPLYLARMRRAAAAYSAWRANEEELDFEPFDSESAPAGDGKKPGAPNAVEPPTPAAAPAASLAPKAAPAAPVEPADPAAAPAAPAVAPPAPVAPTVPAAPAPSLDKSTQTDDVKTETEPQAVPLAPRPDCTPPPKGVLIEVKAEVKEADTNRDTPDAVEADAEVDGCGAPGKAEGEAPANESDGERKSSWWRYLYPFYYFV